ncbi:MAG: DUF3750 domain-containing protein [Parvibaculaceae bacterium]
MRAVFRLAFWFVLILIALPIAVGAMTSYAKGWPQSWRAADWTSTGTLADPSADPEAMIAVYAARSGRWKGIFADHHWIVIKPRGAASYTRYEVVGWGTPVRRNSRAPDGRWYGNVPVKVFLLRGPRAETLIPKVEAAVASYPWTESGSYRVWPGPNSNTFVAHVLRQVTELGAMMTPTGVGKDYLGPGVQFARMPSGTGWQVSLWGILGAGVSRREGLELHFLGSTIGISPSQYAISLPAIGRLSLAPAVRG